MIKTACVAVLAGVPEEVEIPSNSGKGQVILRCPVCRVALWSHYGGQRKLAFVRVGTLEVPSACPPDIHIFTATKLDWLVLDGPEPGGRVPVVTAYYVRETYWPAESLRRRKGMLGKG